MEKDNALKELLEKSSLTASADFTANVMFAVDAFATKPLVYEPLVSPFVKRILIVTVSSILFLILLVSIYIAVPDLGFMSILPVPNIAPETYQKFISAIAIFWAVFFLNHLLLKHKVQTAPSL